MIPPVHLGDCVAWLQSLEPESVDAIVCDPPYGLSPDGKARTWDDLTELQRARGGFMGKGWDAGVPGVTWAQACLRVLKPGGHLVAFGGTRTVHRLTTAIEDGGFEIRDIVAWHYLTGFPKNHDVSKAIDARAGAQRAIVGHDTRPIGGNTYNGGRGQWAGGGAITTHATPEAHRWDGWGTALKPSIEPAVLARKPLGSTVAECVLKHGTGALNINACRYAPGDRSWTGPNADLTQTAARRSVYNGVYSGTFGSREATKSTGQQLGRWPANIYRCRKPSVRERERGLSAERMLCHCEDTRAQWDDEDRRAATPAGTGAPRPKATTGSGTTGATDSRTASSGSSTTDRSPQGTRSTTSTKTSRTTGSKTCSSLTRSPTSACTPDASSETVSGGSPAATAISSSPSPRNTGTSTPKEARTTASAGLATSGALWRQSESVKGVRVCLKCLGWDKPVGGAAMVDRKPGSAGLRSPRAGAGRTSKKGRFGVHPTQKPVRLMRWLCRLVGPPGGLIVDPFTGSGTTGIAAVLEGFRFAGAELDPDYHAIACARIEHARQHPEQWADTQIPRVSPSWEPEEPEDEPAPEELLPMLRLMGFGA